MKLASPKLYALRNECGNKIYAMAQKRRRCPSMGWSRVAWQAVLRAWAPFMVDAFETIQERALVYRAPTVAPLSQFVLSVCRV